MGVEEKFLLLADDGSVSPVASRVVELAGLTEQIKPEFMSYQVETATAVCTRLDGLRRDLVRLRLTAADAAERCGVQLVASGAAPLTAHIAPARGGAARLDELARRFPEATAAGGMCACHVHIGLPDRDLAVAVLARIRPWLPALLALTVNSPFAAAQNTGWASYRYHSQLSWPTFRLPGAWADAERYDRAVQALIVSGAALDTASVHLLARLSARYPTIEVRVADTCLDVEDTVFYAGVVRALVASLVDDVRNRVKTMPAPAALIEAQLLTAAHGHLALRPDQSGSPSHLVPRLFDRVAPYLVADLADEVPAGLERLQRLGTGAERQRRMWTGQAGGFARSLAEATVPVAALR